MRSERGVVFLVASVQFINILDFMMVMPLGRDFATALDIPLSHMGWVAGSYTLAAAGAGLVGSLFLDRFDRRAALAVAMGGLVAGTLVGGFAQGLYSLMAARMVAGLFGGPATSLSSSIIADVVPPERRGKAVASVTVAFSLASLAGVPFALKLSQLWGWRAPFWGVGAAGLLVAAVAVWALPPLTGHLERKAVSAKRFDLGWIRSEHMGSLAMTGLMMGAGFVVIPNLAPYVLENLHYPRERLDLLYLAGGTLTLAALRWTGRLVDRFGAFRVGATGGGLVVADSLFLLVRPPAWAPVMVLHPAFMLAMAIRNVALNTLTTRVPLLPERARFASLQSFVQHMAISLAAFGSTRLLSENPDGTLAGVPTVGFVSMGLTAAALWVMARVERSVRAREASSRTAGGDGSGFLSGAEA